MTTYKCKIEVSVDSDIAFTDELDGFVGVSNITELSPKLTSDMYNAILKQLKKLPEGEVSVINLDNGETILHGWEVTNVIRTEILNNKLMLKKKLQRAILEVCPCGDINKFHGSVVIQPSSNGIRYRLIRHLDVTRVIAKIVGNALFLTYERSGILYDLDTVSINESLDKDVVAGEDETIYAKEEDFAKCFANKTSGLRRTVAEAILADIFNSYERVNLIALLDVVDSIHMLIGNDASIRLDEFRATYEASIENQNSIARGYTNRYATVLSSVHDTDICKDKLKHYNDVRPIIQLERKKGVKPAPKHVSVNVLNESVITARTATNALFKSAVCETSNTYGIPDHNSNVRYARNFNPEMWK